MTATATSVVALHIKRSIASPVQSRSNAREPRQLAEGVRGPRVFYMLSAIAYGGRVATTRDSDIDSSPSLRQHYKLYAHLRPLQRLAATVTFNYSKTSLKVSRARTEKGQICTMHSLVRSQRLHILSDNRNCVREWRMKIVLCRCAATMLLI